MANWKPIISFLDPVVPHRNKQYHVISDIYYPGRESLTPRSIQEESMSWIKSNIEIWNEWRFLVKQTWKNQRTGRRIISIEEASHDTILYGIWTHAFKHAHIQNSLCLNLRSFFVRILVDCNRKKTAARDVMVAFCFCWESIAALNYVQDTASFFTTRMTSHCYSGRLRYRKFRPDRTILISPQPERFLSENATIRTGRRRILSENCRELLLWAVDSIVITNEIEHTKRSFIT